LLSVGLAGGAVWVASVENGYVWGTLTRMDVQTGETRVLWRKPDSSVQYVAAGAGGVWALIGSVGTTRIARFSLAGRLSHSRRRTYRPAQTCLSARSCDARSSSPRRQHLPVRRPPWLTSASSA
jgi:hypothetical protein